MPNPLVSLKSKTRSQLSEEYGVSRRTLYNWLNKIDIIQSHRILTPKDLRKIYDHFGLPGEANRSAFHLTE